ncbi:hypothetical protein Zmor_015276 [Zophobas morio]|uniref:Uncharacterized protein n=1 Tax=Zophobas morio TaxID=2755281 RepID=A0AA38MGF4_9CUCU|nr:hypothetical protein Zmor_015276 [Zophobas morio]
MTSSSETLPFRVAEKLYYIYVGNLVVDTECQEINKFLTDKFPLNKFEIEKLPRRESAKSVVFKIGANESLLPELLSEDNWPVGLKLKKFHFLRKLSNGGQQE